MNEKEEIKLLIEELNEASRAYYQESREIMPNFEYDEKYDRLVELEKRTGIVFDNSPTKNIGHEVVSSLPKERHESRMLSLDKTKSEDDLKNFLGDQKGIISWKLDGLTVVLTYEKGKLTKAVTRGNGEIGEIITSNAKVFENVPSEINYKEKLVIRGEAVISYSDFEKINDEIEDIDSKYKNPRNLCSGSVRQLDSKVTAKRHVKFFAFSLVDVGEKDFGNSRKKQFEFLSELNFDVVEHFIVDKESVADKVDYFRKKIGTYDVPSDGLVLSLEDLEYSKSLGTTAKFPKDSIAFKWKDETKETVLLEIEWSPSRTGLINPVAIFEPVELEGTTVSRASVHNVSIVKELDLHIGDKISVYKANMIIPQIAENISSNERKSKINSGNNADKFEKNNEEIDDIRTAEEVTDLIPKFCPVCNGETKVKNEQGTETLHCINSKCPIKKLKSFALLVSRDALNIEGMSQATLEKMLEHGFIKEYKDIYKLDKYKSDIVEMEGFGEKSFENLWRSINNSKKTNLVRVLYGLGIPGIGLANAKIIVKYFDDSFNQIINAKKEELIQIDQMGEVLANEIFNYFHDEENLKRVKDLISELELEKTNTQVENVFDGKTFVITGSLEFFGNRKELQEKIESFGGKCAGSVSKNTNYLINNDINSNSSKNKKAKELNVPIITEKDFMDMI